MSELTPFTLEIVGNSVCYQRCPLNGNCDRTSYIHIYKIDRSTDDYRELPAQYYVRHHPRAVCVSSQSEYYDLGQLRIDILGCEDRARRLTT